MSQEHRSTSGLPPEIQRDRDVERFAKQAKLPPYMWDTLDGLSALARFMDCVRSAKSERTPTGEFSKAAQDVLAERRRQVEQEGWDTEHDDGHVPNALANAAACYAAGEPLFRQRSTDNDPTNRGSRGPMPAFIYPPLWPWSSDWWKPKDRRRDLVRAGALILAELERIDRKEKSRG